MAWITRFLLFLIVFFLLGLIRSFVAKMLKSSGRSRFSNKAATSKNPGETIVGQTVKDPQCGMYVATDLAISSKVGGKVLHFCSEECRRTFIAGLKQS